MVSETGIVIGSITLVVGTFAIEESINWIIGRAAKNAKAGRTVIRDIRASLRVVAALVVASGILGLTGAASEFTLLTFSGVGALATSLALQTSLSNIISGILLFHDGVIRLNDVVEYGAVKGRVVRVALRNTWIKSDSGTLAVVSNSNLSNGPLINHSATERLSKKYAIE
ncbi:MAG: mechanosensitive ion channel domain-containing protein [Conexivisphaerales archaeon]|jgi:MscS family membrane protein